jgi:phage tail-like protein
VKFGEYLWKLLPGVFKRKDDGDVRRWVDVQGEVLDELKLSVFAMRRSWLIATAQGAALDAIGKSRKLPRYPGEDDEAYRRRLSAAWEIYSRGGTIPGMVEALRLIGYPDAEVHELYKDGPVSPFHNGAYRYDREVRHSGGVRWAEFRVRTRLEDEKALTRTDMAVLMDTIYRVKPARSMPVAVEFDLAFQDFVPHQDGIEIDVMFVAHALREPYPWPGHSHDGSLRRSGGVRYNTVLDLSAISMRTGWEDRQRARDVRHDGWFRRRGGVFYGEQPTFLDVGGTGVVARWEEELLSSDAGRHRLHVALEGRSKHYLHDGSLWRFGGSPYGHRPMEATDQFPAGPTLHDGRVPRAAIRMYGQDRAGDEFEHGLALHCEESVPGTASYGSSHLRHDGNGSAWWHNGRIQRAPRYTYGGRHVHSGAPLRRLSVHRYGDKALRRNGLATYGRPIPRDGTWTHGANGVRDVFDISVTRYGQRVAV